MPAFIRRLQEVLIGLHEIKEERLGQPRRIEASQHLKSLLKDLKAYNRVFMRDYETYLEQVIIQLKMRVRLSLPQANQARIKEARERNLHF